jgi:hypothetical protein
MAGASLLTLLDDVATLLDDIALMTKTSASKTAGVLGDDLALNAQQVTGVRAERELAVVWSVAKGAFVNKLILIPAAMLISAFAPWALMPLLMIGGAFLCFEGFEKLLHAIKPHTPSESESEEQKRRILRSKNLDPEKYEQEKIKGAIRTDFILSAEIIAITLGTVAQSSLLVQFIVLALIGVGVTVGVYGVVAGIVRLDDLGLYLKKRGSTFWDKVGNAILAFCPKLMHGLSFIGTAAMFLVGGGILVHGFDFLHHGVENLASSMDMFGWAIPHLAGPVVGIVAGAALVLAFEGAEKALSKVMA